MCDSPFLVHVVSAPIYSVDLYAITALFVFSKIHSLEHPESGSDSDIEPPGVLDWITTLLYSKQYPARACAARGKVISRGWCPDSYPTPRMRSEGDCSWPI